MHNFINAVKGDEIEFDKNLMSELKVINAFYDQRRKAISYTDGSKWCTKDAAE
jgi:hypothetical protein